MLDFRFSIMNFGFSILKNSQGVELRVYTKAVHCKQKSAWNLMCICDVRLMYALVKIFFKISHKLSQIFPIVEFYEKFKKIGKVRTMSEKWWEKY